MTPPGKPEHIVEAALFSAGRPLSVEEIADETGLSKAVVTKTVKGLQATYKDRDTALEVGPAGTKWGMQVRTLVADDAAKFAPMEIPKKTLKTLALIAYHQPLKQSELVDMIGSKTYEHVGELRERGLITARRDGLTKTLTTTPSFPEYFGLEAGDTEGVRAAMAELVGLPPPERKKKDRDLKGFQDPAGADDTGDEAGRDAPPGDESPEAQGDPQGPGTDDASTPEAASRNDPDKAPTDAAEHEKTAQDDEEAETGPEATEDPQTA